MLSVNPVLDQRRVWGEQNGKDLADTESNDERWVALSFIFRPSQQKFSGVPSESIGVVKYSSPSSVALNQRLINILDQVCQTIRSVSAVSKIQYFIAHLHFRYPPCKAVSCTAASLGGYIRY